MLQTNAIRPIMVNSSWFNKKQMILSNAMKFKETAYSADRDYSVETRAIRNKLWEYAKVKRVNKEKVKLSLYKLIVNRRAFQ